MLDALRIVENIGGRQNCLELDRFSCVARHSADDARGARGETSSWLRLEWTLRFEFGSTEFLNRVRRMEALSAGTELGSEVSAAINLAAEEHATITLHCTKEGLLLATLVDLKEKCMQILGAHLQRHLVPLDEPDLDVLDETFEDDEASKGELVEEKGNKT